jgi:hypothetical protein
MNQILIAAAVAATLLTGAAMAREDEGGSTPRPAAPAAMAHPHHGMGAGMSAMRERGQERMRAGGRHEHGQHNHGAAAGSAHEHGDCPMHAPRAATP